MARLPHPDEAAAISAAVQRFLAETARAVAEEPAEAPAWQRAALLEGVSAKAAVGVRHGKGGEKWLS